MKQLLFIELNEINFEHVRAYVERGELPALARLLDQNSLSLTTSEAKYEELEPWIQWVTAHTGLTLAEHGVFRLGDIHRHDLPQIWEVLEQKGVKVGAVSPMNANNRCLDPAFFVPDPWTPAKCTGSALLQHLHNAVAQAVNDNAQSKITPQSLISLLAGSARYARPSNYSKYAALIAQARQKPWSKAMFLDLLLADIFFKETQRTKPGFASLFLNAGAHIQHHYMFNSAAYDGSLKNPEWYAAPNVDPVLDIYRLYDRIIGQVARTYPDARLMIATGLHQNPHPNVTFYWRLKNHAAFLKKIGAAFDTIEPRMSRDFVVTCNSAEDARNTEALLASAVASDGVALFDVDNRGKDLFVMLVYPHEITDDFVYSVGEERYQGLREDVCFVAIKNGEHDGIGYFIDTGSEPGETPHTFRLHEMPSLICRALGFEWKAALPIAAQ